MLSPLPSPVSGRLPVWYQVSQSLRAYIVHRSTDEPTRLPTEASLARYYRVSVATVRQALSTLEAEGLVSRHRRRGTFINPRAHEPRPLRFLGTADTVVAQQVSEESRLLGRGAGPVPAVFAAAFGDDAEVAVFRRLRYENGEPVSYAENFIPVHYAERILDEDLACAPMTEVLRDRVGLELGRIDNVLQAQRSTPHLAGLLGTEPDEPILLSTNLTFDTDGQVVDAALIHYRGDRFRFALSLELA
ncbi:GntR family transcriptional regulator [Pseudonocardia hispaniensis]|uniref:GntR family transcriptional regulator n=1 Tax=Pseudonocardia hispaniensis TaxID=904933 RepID=A0ABW1IZ54_9PSEU